MREIGSNPNFTPPKSPICILGKHICSKTGVPIMPIWVNQGYTAKREMSEEKRVSPMIFLTWNALGVGGVEIMSGARYSEKRYCRYGATHFFILLITNITYLYYCLFIGLTFWCYLFIGTHIRLGVLSIPMLSYYTYHFYFFVPLLHSFF